MIAMFGECPSHSGQSMLHCSICALETQRAKKPTKNLKLSDFIVIWERGSKTVVRGFDIRVQFDGLNWSRAHFTEGMSAKGVADELRHLADRIEEYHG